MKENAMKESGMNTLSMVDLDRAVSLSVARARQTPLLVTNRHKPWVWMVSHETWRRERQYLEYIPDNHPLVVLRDIVDQHLVHRAEILRQLATDLDLRIMPHVLCRALVLQVMYAVSSVRVLYENIGYNMAYRRFVGVDTCLPLWPYADFERDMQALAGSRMVAELVEFVVRQCASVPQAEMEFRLNRGRSQTRAASQSDEADRAMRRLPPRML